MLLFFVQAGDEGTGRQLAHGLVVHILAINNEISHVIFQPRGFVLR